LVKFREIFVFGQGQCGTVGSSSRSPGINWLMETTMGRGILLWLLGVPIPVIILLWLFFGR